MALFNKLFTTKNTHYKHQDNVSEKLFAFNSDQIRLVLFKECDFRGRKLLFDSSSVKKIPLDQKEEQNEKFAEVSNGHGYVYKPQSDISQLAEMVFGTVAMSYRGTYFKIHCLSEPHRLMFTQVFPSPGHTGKHRMSVSSRSCPRTSTQSLEHSIKLDDSGASSTNSMSEQLSVHSTVSDTVLVCRLHSRPLDFPNFNTASISNSSVVGDSGCGGQSYCSVSSGPPSLPLWESTFPNNINGPTLSSGSLYKKLLRSTSTSLDHSGSSLTGSGSVEESYTKPLHRSNKLALALVVELTKGQEEKLSRFLMEHVCLVESMIWRTRHSIEIAYNRPKIFFSLMMDIANLTAQWLVNLLSGPFLANNAWQMLSNGCDNRNSISAFSDKLTDINRSSSSSNLEIKNSGNNNNNKGLYNSFNGYSNGNLEKTNEFNFFNLTKFLRAHPESLSKRKKLLSVDKSVSVEKFLKEFCETLEAVDVKGTNFFISTLLTAVLTHHLGWVSTCLPPSPEEVDLQSNFRNPYNCLWGQLSDLFGAVGHPIKMAQTIISGDDNDLSTKLLKCLTYFIRCIDIERRDITRVNVEEENKLVEDICQENSCIPEENYKKYEDHLKEIMSFKPLLMNGCPKPKCAKPMTSILKPRLTKTSTCAAKLSDMMREVPELKKQTYEFNLPYQEKSDLDFPLKLTSEKPSSELEDEQKDKVIFVLGDNEELVGIKKDNFEDLPCTTTTMAKRPSFLDLSQFAMCKNIPNDNLTGNFKDEDFVKREITDEASKIKPSTSWRNCLENSECSAASLPKPYTRSQSVPPEERKLELDTSDDIKTKYRYSGVKFNLQQYPQIVKNYMKSKNLEIGNLPLGEKASKFGELSATPNTYRLDFSGYESDSEEVEALQTPSNASELEFTSDLFTDLPKVQHAKESSVEALKASFVKKSVPNTIIKEHPAGEKKLARKLSIVEEKVDVFSQKMQIVNLPMPKSISNNESSDSFVSYTSSVMRGLVDNYVPDMVLQATSVPKNHWDFKLKSDLALTSQHSLLDQPIEEAVAIVANTDTWEVQLISSHTYVIDKSSTGIPVGMSQLVANMLESLLYMWKLQVPPQYCLMHIEQKLQELCIRSKALAQLLLATEFCSMEFLTSTLHLEVNDVPLLMAVASTHTPQVTQKYGLSFQ